MSLLKSKSKKHGSRSRQVSWCIQIRLSSKQGICSWGADRPLTARDGLICKLTIVRNSLIYSGIILLQLIISELAFRLKYGELWRHWAWCQTKCSLCCWLLPTHTSLPNIVKFWSNIIQHFGRPSSSEFYTIFRQILKAWACIIRKPCQQYQSCWIKLHIIAMKNFTKCLKWSNWTPEAWKARPQFAQFASWSRFLFWLNTAKCFPGAGF